MRYFCLTSLFLCFTLGSSVAKNNLNKRNYIKITGEKTIMKNATKKVTEQATENINTVVDLTQDTARATVNTSIEVVKLAENSLQGLYKVGYDLNEAGLEVAKGYWDALSTIRNEWIDLLSQTGEKAVDSIGTLKNLEIPFQKEVIEFSDSILAQGGKVFNMATEQVKNVTETVTNQVEKTTEVVSGKAKKAASGK
jgi:hypothetical protein